MLKFLSAMWMNAPRINRNNFDAGPTENSTESNKFFIELVCFPGQVLKQCKTLGQSLDHGALVAINKKLEKEPQTRTAFVFRRCRIHFIEWVASKKGKKKETKYVFIVKHFWTLHLAPAISKVSGFQNIRFQIICKYIGRIKYSAIKMRKCFKLDGRRDISETLYLVLNYLLHSDCCPFRYFLRVLFHNITNLFGWAFTARLIVCKTKT